MAIVTSITGSSGSGKSRSMKTLIERDDVMIIRPSKKPFSFKNKAKQWDRETKTGTFFYANEVPSAIAVMKKMDEVGKKIIILEDSTFFMTDYFMKTALDVGYEKFTANALHYYNLIKAAESLSDDVRIYLINHIDEDSNGFKKMKTIGKMLDEKICIESLITIVLESKMIDGKYTFLTNKDDFRDLAKSPENMFKDSHIPNDLNEVDNKICEYYNISKT